MQDEKNWIYATGFFISDNGILLTNKHVVLNSSSNSVYNVIEVRTATNNDWISAEVLKISETTDLAKLKVNLTRTSYFKLSETYMPGDTIFTIGNPNGFGLSFTSGVLSSNERIVIYKNKEINALQTSFVINEGNSGGPVFNKQGKLIGIISFQLKNRNNDVLQGVSFALPSTTIKEFINQ